MNWNQLKYVMTVAEEKNISKAAKKLYISQPSLSISIGQLEKELGSVLFERTSNSMELTYTGELFYQWAKMVLYSKNQMQEKFNSLCVGKRERISIGISPHRSAVLTPELVRAVHEEFPECELRIVEKPNNELTVLLAEDRLDMIINIPSSDYLTYESEIVVDEEICIGVPRKLVETIPELKENKSKEISLNLLKNEKFILLPKESYFGKMSRQALKEAGIVPDVLCECTFSETAKKLVESGAGVAFLPDILSVYDSKNEKKLIEFYGIKDTKVKRTIAVVYKKEKYHSEQFMKIVRIFKQCFLDVYLPNTRRKYEEK